MPSPVFLLISLRNGSQMLFRLDVVSVEMMPKLTSSAAVAGAVAHVTAMAAAISCRSMSSLLSCSLFSPCCLPNPLVRKRMVPISRRCGGGGGALPGGFASQHVGRASIGWLLARPRWQEQFLALSAVQLAQEVGCQCARWPVIDDATIAQRDRAPAIAQRIFDLVQRNQHGDVVFAVQGGKDVHHAPRGFGVERGDGLVGEIGRAHV